MARCHGSATSDKSYEAAGNRALHVVICALNFTYSSRACPPLELLRRQPNKLQKEAIERLRLLIKACDHGAPVQVASSGRKNSQLMAGIGCRCIGLILKPSPS